MPAQHLPLKVLYTGAFPDLSGYASAARDYVRSLDSVGIDVTADMVTFEPWKPAHLRDEVMDRRLYSLRDKPHDAPLHIIHLTPDNYRKPEYVDSPRYRIGYFAWETSRLPHPWVKCLNETVHETWVPCEKLREVCIDSGVTIPCYVLPHAIPVPPEDFQSTCEFSGIPEDCYKFYSVFQWSERKNPAALIRAYYEEFSKREKVCLVLKTYRLGNDRTERDFIRREISRLKRETKGVEAPPIVLIEEFLSNRDLIDLHRACDCYVSMARAEGFGIPAFEAAAAKNPVIVPNNWAFPEHFSQETGWLVDVPQEVPISDMRHISILYTGDMTWGDPSVSSCRAAMREAFENQDSAKEKGKVGYDYVKDKLSYMSIGRMMKARLEQVYRGLVERRKG